MSNRSRTRKEDLSQKHYYQVVRRSDEQRAAMRGVWGATWNTRGETLLPVGKVSMMVMSRHDNPRAKRGESIELRCVTARVVDNVICYDQIRMVHDFEQNPKKGAFGRRLDPRDEGTVTDPKARPAGEWTRLGLGLDRELAKAATQQWALSAVPTMPRHWAGVPDPAHLDCPDTPALRSLYILESGETRDKVMGIPTEDFPALAHELWADKWLAPGEGINNTHLYLLPTEYFGDKGQAHQLLTDFSEMQGVHTYNPVRDLKTLSFENRSSAVSSSKGIDLPETLKALDAANETGCDAQTADSSGTLCNPREAEARIQVVMDAMREWLGAYAELASDEVLLDAMRHRDKPIVVRVKDPVNAIQPDDAVRAMRELLRKSRPLIEAGTTDQDLLEAALSPRDPLFASNICINQALAMDCETAPEEFFQFAPHELGRWDVSASLWATEDWKPAGSPRRRRRPAKRKRQHVESR